MVNDAFLPQLKVLTMMINGGFQVAPWDGHNSVTATRGLLAAP